MSASSFQKEADSVAIKIVGKQKFIMMRDLQFMMTSEDDEHLKKYEQSLKKYGSKVKYGGLGVLTLALVSNITVQRIVMKRHSPPRYLFTLFDIVFYSSFAYFFVDYITKPFKDPSSQLYRLKSELIQMRHPRYLQHIRDNSNCYRISIQQQMQNRKIPTPEFQNILFELRQLSNSKPSSL